MVGGSLTLLLALSAVAVADDCFLPGVCIGQPFLIHQEKAEDANACLFACQDYEDINNYVCNVWSYGPNSQDCFMFQDCPNIGVDDAKCEACIYGESTCEPVYNCDLVGSCQGRAFGIHQVASRDECVEDCLEEDGCNFWSYDSTDGRCIYYDVCDTRDPNPDYLSGEKLCQTGDGGLISHKVLLATGLSNGAIKAEIVDVLDATATASCPTLGDLPSGVFGAGGGFSVARNKAIVCGGSGLTNTASLRDCYELNPLTNTWIRRTSGMLAARSEVAYVQINPDQFWISGGWGTNNYLATGELYDAATDRFTTGPSLPELRGQHCIVRLSSTQFLVVGGIPAQLSEDVQLYTTTDTPGSFSRGTFMSKAPLSGGRRGAFCGSVKRTNAATGEEYYEAVVTGGVSDLSSFDQTTYIYNLDSNTWRMGPRFPEAVAYGTTVPYGDSFLAIDGDSEAIVDPKSVYQFVAGTLGPDTWLKLNQATIETSRSYSVGFLIPDDFVNCSGEVEAGTTTRGPFIG